MRTVFIALLTLSTSVTLMAQEKKWGATPADSVKCWEDFNIFGTLIETRAYTDAYEHWDRVYKNCPQANKNTFIYAPRVLKAKIREAVTEEEKAKYADQLIESYDKRLEYFPGKEAYVKGEKASALLKYKKDFAAAYAAFTEAYEIDSKIMSPAQINGYFLSSVKMYNNDKAIELEKLIHVYLRCQEAIAQNRIHLTKTIAELTAKEEADGSLSKKEGRKKTSSEKNLAAYQKVEKNIEIAIAPLLSCKNLAILVNQESFGKNKTNKKWLARAARLLQKERIGADGEKTNCTDNALFEPIAITMIELEPSAAGYRALAMMNYKKRNYSKANEYYKKAVALEEDPKVLGRDYLAIADCYKNLGSLSTAKKFTLKSKAMLPGSGQPYILLAAIYAEAAGSCGNNAVEKNGVYWAAIDLCMKAKQIDPEMKKIADKSIAAYKKGVPGKEVAFNLNYIEGQTLTLGCWINETVSVRFY